MRHFFTSTFPSVASSIFIRNSMQLRFLFLQVPPMLSMAFWRPLACFSSGRTADWYVRDTTNNNVTVTV